MKLTLRNNIGTCPICGEDLRHSYDERSGGKHTDLYTCDSCDIGVIYISPDDGRNEYHLFNDCEIEVKFER